MLRPLEGCAMLSLALRNDDEAHVLDYSFAWIWIAAHEVFHTESADQHRLSVADLRVSLAACLAAEFRW